MFLELLLWDTEASASLVPVTDGLCLLIPGLSRPAKRTVTPNANLPLSQMSCPESP